MTTCSVTCRTNAFGNVPGDPTPRATGTRGTGDINDDAFVWHEGSGTTSGDVLDDVPGERLFHEGQPNVLRATGRTGQDDDVPVWHTEGRGLALTGSYGAVDNSKHGRGTGEMLNAFT